MIDSYTRKVSAEEAREGYLMVLKDRLTFFPPEGKPFVLTFEGGVHEAVVDSRHCECRGPDKPHDHYFIRMPGLMKGERVAIAASPGGYALTPAER